MRRVISRIGALIAGAATLVFISAAPARADGTFRWQNEYNGWYLEIWLSSMANEGRAITYPYNGSSANQLWSDYKQSDGYYRIVNNNSWKSLGHGDRPVGHDSRLCGFPDQYDWLDSPYQHWKGKRFWDTYLNRQFVGWANKVGCQGNPYHDMLGADLLRSGGYPVETYLWTEEICSDQAFGSPTMCYWRRNGQ
ncbi:RICIN domain-containing protein [Nonomuraea sp. NPDC055795]